MHDATTDEDDGRGPRREDAISYKAGRTRRVETRLEPATQYSKRECMDVTCVLTNAVIVSIRDALNRHGVLALNRRSPCALPALRTKEQSKETDDAPGIAFWAASAGKVRTLVRALFTRCFSQVLRATRDRAPGLVRWLRSRHGMISLHCWRNFITILCYRLRTYTNTDVQMTAKYLV